MFKEILNPKDIRVFVRITVKQRNALKLKVLKKRTSVQTVLLEFIKNYIKA